MWFGVIFIRHGLYQDGVFKFTVYIPDNYPDGDCPVSGFVCPGIFLIFWCVKYDFFLIYQLASHFLELVLLSWLGSFAVACTYFLTFVEELCYSDS